MIAPGRKAQELIEGLVQSTGEPDPVSAIRKRAREVIDTFIMVFGEPDEMPLNLAILASFLGIKPSSDMPRFSPDAELAPDGDGGVEMRLNPDQPGTRQRFSVGHEITHTFFPDHSSHVWPRADARHRDLKDPSDYLEMLCDVGASELVFPLRFFMRDASEVKNAAGLVRLSQRYQASREATLRRYAELHVDALAAIFLSWKLKPTQKGRIGNLDQTNLFGISPTEEARAARRLRIEYWIPSQAFSTRGFYLPKDKSVASEGPLYEASRSAQPTDGECYLDCGAAAGTYVVHAVPLWTSTEDTSPNGESEVAAIIRPLKLRTPHKQEQSKQRGLFE